MIWPIMDLILNSEEKMSREFILKIFNEYKQIEKNFESAKEKVLSTREKLTLATEIVLSIYGLSYRQLAKIMGITSERLHQLRKGKTPVKAETILEFFRKLQNLEKLLHEKKVIGSKNK